MWGSLSWHPRRLTHSRAVFAKSQNTPPGKSTDGCGGNVSEALCNLKRAMKASGMRADEGRESRETWTRPRTGALGRQERCRKKAERCVPGEDSA